MDRYEVRHDTSRHGVWTVYDTEDDTEVWGSVDRAKAEAKCDSLNAG